MKKDNFYKKQKFVLLCIVLTFTILLFTKVLFFNEFGTDDGDQADISLNILKGKFILNFQGNYLDCRRYFLFHPPLYFVLLSIVFKILGVTYLTSKLVSVFLAVLLAALVSIYCYKNIGASIGLIIASLILFDPLLFSFTYINRIDITATFFFTLAALLFIEAEKKNSLKFIVLSGIFSGAAMLSSYNCNWLFIAFFGYALYLIFTTGIKKNYKKIVSYSASSFIVMAPWYGWVLLDKVRRPLLFTQIIGQTASINGYSLPQIIRKLLSPLADLYLVLFRHYSPFTIITLLVLIYFLSNLKKYLYPFLLLVTSIAMMFFNQRAAHYYIIIMPTCYILFGYVLKDFLAERHLKLSLRRLIYVSLVLTIFIGISNVSRLIFKESDLKLDSQYFSYIIKQYTEDGSRIATDPVFVLSDHGNRDIVQAGLLIWKWFRKPYKNYDEMIFKVVDADYIILTERQKRWGELPIDQSIEFQKYLKEGCTLLNVVDDKIHGPIWIYKSNHKNIR